MQNVHMLCDKLTDGINALQQRIGAKEWKSYSRSSFIFNLTNTIAELEEITSLLRMIDEEFKRNSLEGAPQLNENIGELEGITELLKRNQKLEEASIKKAKERGLQELVEEVEKPELYSNLEHRVMNTLLKTRYLLDRVRIFMRKQSMKPVTLAPAVRNIFDLLEEKEEELQKLKHKYEEIRAKSFMGAIEESTSADLERELNETARKFEAESTVMKKNLEDCREAVEAAVRSQAALEKKAGEIEELNVKQLAKTFELITLLKKERDYAKKVVLEIEHETLHLRSAYSKELLALEEEKENARNAAYEKFRKQLSKLQSEARDKDELAKHLRNIVTEREARIAELKEKISRQKEKAREKLAKKKEKK